MYDPADQSTNQIKWNYSCFHCLSPDERFPFVDLLASSLLQQSQGVKRQNPTGWHLSPDFPGISQNNPSRGAGSNSTGGDISHFRGQLAFQFSGLLSDTSQGTLLRVYPAGDGHTVSLPRLEISLDLPNGDLVLRYLGSRSFQRMRLEDALPQQRWMNLGISINGKEMKVSVDCKRTSSFSLRQPIGALHRDSVIAFGVKQNHQQGLQVICDKNKAFETKKYHCYSVVL